MSDALRATMVFPARDGRSPEEAIRDFIHTSRLELADLGAPVTANVFGRVITETGGSGIGQEWDRLVRVTDLVLPMVYPSMYWPGNFGVAQPDEDPYRLVRAALDSATSRLRRTSGATARLRPWLQAFSHGGTTYGAGQIRDQIRAVEDAGLHEWLFWNAESVYPAGAFQQPVHSMDRWNRAGSGSGSIRGGRCIGGPRASVGGGATTGSPSGDAGMGSLVSTALTPVRISLVLMTAFGLCALRAE